MSWRAELDALKRRASSQTQKTTADSRKILDAMGTGIPDVRTSGVIKDGVASFDAAVAGFDTAMNRHGIDPSQSSITTHGWLLFLSRVATDAGHVWHLSASLHPRGRSSTVKDWKMLGYLAMHLGAPRDPTIMPEDPTRVIHWQWSEGS